MAKQVYFDCNIIIDWNLERQPFNKQANMLIYLVEQGVIQGFVSPLALANAHYAIKKAKNKALANEFVQYCQQLFAFIDNSTNALTQAINNHYKDFEDDLHFYSAIDSKMDMIVTRNTKDFLNNHLIKIVTPDELLYELGY